MENYKLKSAAPQKISYLERQKAKKRLQMIWAGVIIIVWTLIVLSGKL